MKKLFVFYFLMLLMFISIPTITDAETTTSDTIVIETPKEITTGDTIIIEQPEEFSPQKLVKRLQENGNKSDEFVDHVSIDLTNITNGTIVYTYYSGKDQIETIKTINVPSKTVEEAKDILFRFTLTLSSRYKPNAQLAIWNNEDYYISNIYSVGEQRVNAILNLNDGLVEAFNNKPVKYGNDNDWVDKYNPVIVDNKVKILTQVEIEELKKEYQEVKTSFQEFLETNAIVKLIKDVFSF